MNKEQKIAAIIQHDRFSRFHELVKDFLVSGNKELLELGETLSTQYTHSQTQLGSTPQGVAVLEAVADRSLSAKAALDLLKIIQIPNEGSAAIDASVKDMVEKGLTQKLINPKEAEAITAKGQQLVEWVRNVVAPLIRVANSRLLDATKNGNISAVQTALEDGADVNAKRGEDENEVSLTALHLAAADGNYEIAKLLIDRKANVNVKTDAGLTPLHFASTLRDTNIAELLLKNRADPNAKDIFEETPLDKANYGLKVPANQRGRTPIELLLQEAQKKQGFAGREEVKPSYEEDVTDHKTGTNLLGH